MKVSRRTLIRGITASTAGGLLIKYAAAADPQVAVDRRFPYLQMDVFTSQRLQGNQLTVFTDARGLSDAEMLALARETNLQETTFVFPRDAATERREGVKVRIFNPSDEMPFAGHPTLGTANVFRMQDPSRPSTVVLDLKAGRIPVVFRDDVRGAFGEMTQLDPVFGKTHDRARVAQVIGLRPDDLDADLPIQTVSTGLAFVWCPFARSRRCNDCTWTLTGMTHTCRLRGRTLLTSTTSREKPAILKSAFVRAISTVLAKTQPLALLLAALPRGWSSMA